MNVVEQIEQTTEKQQAPPTMIHVVDSWVDDGLALCGTKLKGKFFPSDSIIDCIVCAEIEKTYPW